MKIISVYLNVLSIYRRMAFFFLKYLFYNTVLYFKITYKNVVIQKKETQRLALYQGSPKEKI